MPNPLKVIGVLIRDVAAPLGVIVAHSLVCNVIITSLLVERVLFLRKKCTST